MYNAIVLNMNAPSEEKSDDSKDRFCEELGQVFEHFPKYHIKFLIGYFNTKLGRDYICKPKIGKMCLHQDSNDNGVKY